MFAQAFRLPRHPSFDDEDTYTYLDIYIQISTTQGLWALILCLVKNPRITSESFLHMHSFKQLITGHNFRIGSYLYSHTIQNILYVNKESEIVTRRSLCARCIVRPNKPNVGIWGIQMKFYFRATQGELVA